MMKKILCVIVLLLLSSCGKSSIEVEKDVESEQDTVAVSETEAPADTIENTNSDSVFDFASDDIPVDDNTESNESDNLNFPEETEIAEEDSVLDPSLEEELNVVRDLAVKRGYTKNWETVFSENLGLTCCTDTEGREVFGELHSEYWFLSENDIVSDRKCIAFLIFGHNYIYDVVPTEILDSLLEISPSVVTYHEEQIFDCYEKGYYEFVYKGDVYCFMKRDYHVRNTDEGEMTECTDILIRMAGEEIPTGQMEVVSQSLSSNQFNEHYSNAGFCDDILNYLDSHILEDSVTLLGQNIRELTEKGIITQVNHHDDVFYCQFDGMDIKILGDRDDVNVACACIPMSEIFTGDETWDYNRIKELFGGGFSFWWFNTYSKQNPYTYYFRISSGLSVYLAANSDSTLDMDGWCAIR